MLVNVWIWLPALVLALLLLSTFSIALRTLSRSRLADEFAQLGREDRIETFLAKRLRLQLAMSILRSVVVCALFAVAMLSQASVGKEVQALELYLALGGTLAIVLVFGVAIPSAWSKYAGVWLVTRADFLIVLLAWIAYPIAVLLGAFDPLVRRLAGVPAQDAKSYADQLEQQILDAVSEGERHGAVDEEEKEMIESVIELSDTRVEEIMTPRTDVVAIPKGAALESVLELLRTKGHSRLPVYDETIDSILGVLYVKDLIRRPNDEPFEVTAVMRDILFIPESKPVRDLLREFQSKKVHIAAVLDEYGGTAGLVTIEDILEELVGEIADEYETEVPAELKRIDSEHVEVDARMRIDQLNDELDLELPEDDDFETIGGFVFSHMGKIPSIGEQCHHDQIGIRVLAADKRRILRVQLHIPSPANKSSTG